MCWGANPEPRHEDQDRHCSVAPEIISSPLPTSIDPNHLPEPSIEMSITVSLLESEGTHFPHSLVLNHTSPFISSHLSLIVIIIICWFKLQQSTAQAGRKNKLQQDLPTMLQKWRKTYKNQHNYLNGTTVKSEIKGILNFDSNWNLPVGARLYIFKTLTLLKTCGIAYNKKEEKEDNETLTGL